MNGGWQQSALVALGLDRELLGAGEVVTSGKRHGADRPPGALDEHALAGEAQHARHRAPLTERTIAMQLQHFEGVASRIAAAHGAVVRAAWGASLFEVQAPAPFSVRLSRDDLASWIPGSADGTTAYLDLPPGTMALLRNIPLLLARAPSGDLEVYENEALVLAGYRQPDRLQVELPFALEEVPGWLRAEVADLLASGHPYDAAAAVGTLYRLCDPPGHEGKGALDALLEGRGHPGFDWAHAWFAKLDRVLCLWLDNAAASEAMLLAERFEEAFEDAADEERARPAHEDLAFERLLHGLLLRRDHLQSVRVLLRAGGRDRRLRAALSDLDAVGRSVVTALDPCPIPDDERFWAARTADPGSFWADPEAPSWG